MNHRELEQLRMLADWQLRELGHDPTEISRLCREEDEFREKCNTKKLLKRLKEGECDELSTLPK